MRRWFFENDLADICRVHRNPTVFTKIYLHAAVLALGGFVRRYPKASVAQVRFGNPQTINMSRRQGYGACQANVESIQVGTFSAHIARLQHEPNVSAPAAADLRIAE